jgi:hypothetical protein
MPFVYFIHEESNPIVMKVGKTELHPADRMAQLQTGNPRRLVIYRWIEIADHGAAETYLHEKYKDLNILNEWFHMTPAMVDEECETILMNMKATNALNGEVKGGDAPGRILDEDVKLSNRYPRWNDEDRIKVQEERQLKGKYRGKRNPRDVANARIAYYDRAIRPQRNERNERNERNDRNEPNDVPKKLFSDD